MPLTDLQRELAAILYASGDNKVYLAGAGGLIVQGIVDRDTDDLDGFIHSQENFPVIVDAAEQALRDAGYELVPDPLSRNSDPADIRTWLVHKAGQSEVTKIQFARDYIVLPPSAK